ncbi:MAG: lysylphosphatidylglycerol synthase transmembrane domain-containing protein [Alphaproteobacteria bacterium]
MALLKAVLKVAVSALLIWFLLRGTDLDLLWAQVTGIGIFAFVIASCLIGGLCFPAAVRWRWVLGILGRAIGLGDALRIVAIGLFFNQVLPSSVGGDAVRMWLAHRAGIEPRTAVTSVVIDRALGLSVVFLMTAAALPWLLPLVPRAELRAAFMLVSLGGLVGIGALCLLDRFARLLPRWTLIVWVEALASGWRALLISRIGFRAVALSIAMQVIFALAVFVLGFSLDLGIALFDCLILVPPVVLMMALPISIAGWGVREGAMVVMFGFIGISDHDALALSVLVGAATLAGSLPGGAVWLVTGAARWRAAERGGDKT